MFASRIILALFLVLLSGRMFAAESERPPVNPLEMFDVLSHGIGAGEKLVSEASLAFSKSNEAEVDLFLNSFQEKPDKIGKGIFPGERFKFIQAYYPNYFLVFFIGNRADKWNGILYSVSFSLRRPGPEVHPEDTDIYKVIKSMHGHHSRSEKFGLRYKTKLRSYIWVLDDVVITYRSFHDSKKGDNVAVVGYWDKAYFETHDYKNF